MAINMKVVLFFLLSCYVKLKAFCEYINFETSVPSPESKAFTNTPTQRQVAVTMCFIYIYFILNRWMTEKQWFLRAAEAEEYPDMP